MSSVPDAIAAAPIFQGIHDSDRTALLGCLKTYTRSYRKG